MLLFGGNANNGPLCGLVYATANDGFGFATAYVGARLGFKSKELTIKCVEQFPELWYDYLIGK